MEARNASFLYLSSKGEVDYVRKLIAEGVDINVYDEDGSTAVHKAAEGNHVEVLKVLLKNGADVNAVNNDGNNALHVAVLCYSVECVKLLLSKNIKLNQFNNNDESELMCALKLKSAEIINSNESNPKKKIIELLIDQENIDLRCSKKQAKAIMKGSNYLFYAIKHQNYFAVKRILENEPALLNIADSDGNYAVHHAASNDDVEILKYLLSFNEELVNMRGENNETPLHCAIVSLSLNAVVYLIQQNADANLFDKNGFTPLHFAIHTHLLICKEILNNKEVVNAVDSNDDNSNKDVPEIFSEMEGEFKPDYAFLTLALYLIEKGNANIYLSNIEGKTPIDMLENQKDAARTLEMKYIQKQVIDKIQNTMSDTKNCQCCSNNCGTIRNENLELKDRVSKLEMEVEQLKKETGCAKTLHDKGDAVNLKNGEDNFKLIESFNLLKQEVRSIREQLKNNPKSTKQSYDDAVSSNQILLDQLSLRKINEKHMSDKISKCVCGNDISFRLQCRHEVCSDCYDSFSSKCRVCLSS